MNVQITIKLYVFVSVLASTLRLHFAEESSARADNLDEVVNLQLILAGARVHEQDDEIEYFQLVIGGFAACKKYVVCAGLHIL